MTWRLISEDTGAELHVGDQVRTFRGEVYRLKGMTPPHKASSSGRVLLDNGAEYFPGVINATFVEMPRVNVFNEDGRRYVP